MEINNIYKFEKEVLIGKAVLILRTYYLMTSQHMIFLRTLTNWSNLDCQFYLILFWNVFFILVHDYNLCFHNSCYNVSYCNYNSGWPYYIVIHLCDTYLGDKSVIIDKSILLIELQSKDGTTLHIIGVRLYSSWTFWYNIGTKLQDIVTNFQSIVTKLHYIDTKFQDIVTKLQDIGTQFQDILTKLQDIGTRFQDILTKLQDIDFVTKLVASLWHLFIQMQCF